jgi:hypothetical protein
MDTKKLMKANTRAQRMMESRNAKKADWALDWEAEYFDECRADLLKSLEAAGRAMKNDIVKGRLRKLYRVVRAGTFREAVRACFEAAVLITWEGRERGWGQREICNFTSVNTMTDNPTDGHDLFNFGYMTVRKAYY